MSQYASQNPDQNHDPLSSEERPTSETLFLLSICRDEDDAATLRSDLKRSGLDNYKLQRCGGLDDATHLLEVCGFDMIFVRLDDFQNSQSAIDRISQLDSQLSIIALLSGRLLASEGFRLPRGIDAHCRLEDLSPTLTLSLVSGVVSKKREQQSYQRLKQELDLAVQIGELGSWSLDIETGEIALSPKALERLGIAEAEKCQILDDLIELASVPEQNRLKRLFDTAIESQSDIDTSFQIDSQGYPKATIELSAKYRAGGPRTHPTLYGFIKQESQATEKIRARISNVTQAIKVAIGRRDDAIATASKELDQLVKEVDASKSPVSNIQAQKAVPQMLAPTAPIEPVSKSTYGLPPAEPSAPNESLAINKSLALKQVLESISRQKPPVQNNTFPFDFSTETQSDYTEPDPKHDGFIGAAERLVSITQTSHTLAITLSIESDGAIETEREKDLIFDILRELLTNVVKHANASECIIALFRDEDDWVLQVEDDGVGLENNLVSISTPLNKIGLFQVRTKLALKGGQLELTPTFPKGLIARARLPVYLVKRDEERA